MYPKDHVFKLAVLKCSGSMAVYDLHGSHYRMTEATPSTIDRYTTEEPETTSNNYGSSTQFTTTDDYGSTTTTEPTETTTEEPEM